MTGVLMLCATPIGNLSDASPRLAESLKKADFIYAEDTRRSRILLQALGVDAPLRSYFVGNEEQRSQEISRRLAAGAIVALISDAGMPAIADPGLSAVRAAEEIGATVTVIPGPSAVTAAVAASGFPSHRFVFEGFLPRKGVERKGRIKLLAIEERTIVLFSAANRVVADLTDLADAFDSDRAVVIAREISKLHEEIWRGRLKEARAAWSDQTARGEFTLVIAGFDPSAPSLEEALVAVRQRIASGIPAAQAVREVAQASGVRRRQLYEAVHRIDG